MFSCSCIGSHAMFSFYVRLSCLVYLVRSCLGCFTSRCFGSCYRRACGVFGVDFAIVSLPFVLVDRGAGLSSAADGVFCCWACGGRLLAFELVVASGGLVCVARAS